MPTTKRVVGDEGAKARFSISNVKDANDQLVTTGTLTLRAGGLFDGTMTHSGSGTWIYDPVAGDLDTAGTYSLEAHSENGGKVTIPGGDPWTLIVRDRGTAPPA